MRERGGTEIGAAPSASSGDRSIDQCTNRVRAGAAVTAAMGTPPNANRGLCVRLRIGLIE